MSANKTKFHQLLFAAEEDIVRLLFRYRDEQVKKGIERKTLIASKLGMRTAQLICAIGFNPHCRELTDILSILGYDDYEQLIQERNDFFVNDIYRKLSLDNIISIYDRIKDEDDILHVLSYLLKSRLNTIENLIENTVNSSIIDKYKEEMRTIYLDRIVAIDFVEERLNKQDSGFRALLNEVTIITESKIIPAGDIFFRDSILLEERRKLLNRGLIPDDLVQVRLDEEHTSADEKRLLHEHLIKRKSETQI